VHELVDVLPRCLRAAAKSTSTRQGGARPALAYSVGATLKRSMRGLGACDPACQSLT
jgi:hypothetical protein